MKNLVAESPTVNIVRSLDRKASELESYEQPFLLLDTGYNLWRVTGTREFYRNKSWEKNPNIPVFMVNGGQYGFLSLETGIIDRGHGLQNKVLRIVYSAETLGDKSLLNYEAIIHKCKLDDGVISE
jgi:hypothetical protein